MKPLKFTKSLQIGLISWLVSIFSVVYGADPTIEIHVDPQVVKFCGIANFSCEINSTDVEIWWTLKETKLNHTSNITKTSDKTISILQLTCAKLEDTGNYTCHVQSITDNLNTNNSTVEKIYSNSVHLHVADPLRIISSPVVKGEIGASVTLSCSIVGFPVPQAIEWLKNGSSLSSNANINISQRVINDSAISSILEIHNLTENYLGPYTCRATTNVDFITTDVTIFNKGLQAPETPQFEIVDPKTVKLTWQNLPSDGGIRVNSHRINISGNGLSESRIINVTTGETGYGLNHEFWIKDLVEGSNYTVTVIACNDDIGCGDSSTKIIFFLPGYSSPPQDVISTCHHDNISLESYVDIFWSEPADPKDKILKYKVKLTGSASYINSRGTQIVEEDAIHEADTQDSTKRIHVEANTNYTARVCAITAVGCGNYSEVTGNTFCSTPPNVPNEMPHFELKKSEPTEDCRQFKLDMKRINQRNGPIQCYRIVLYKMKHGSEPLPSPHSIDISNYAQVHEDGAFGAYIAESFKGEEFLNEITLGDNIQSRCEIFPSVRQRRSINLNSDENIVQDGELTPDTFYSGFVEVRVTGKDDVVLKRRSNLFSPIRTGYVKYNLQATALGVICGLLIVIIILIVALCTLSKRNNFVDYERRGQSRLRQIFCGVFNRPRRGGLLGTPVLPIPDIKPLKPENLPSAFIERHKDSDLLFQREFEALPEQFRDRTSRASDMLENFFKNRYPDIKAYDQTRVKLSQVEGVVGSDYVNANFVMGYKERKKFICAQGPLDKTVNDFWKMIWEQKVEIIVMVTGLEENGKSKCAKYWPNDEDEKKFGNISVKVENCQIYADYAVRKLRANFKKDDENTESRSICQFHYLTWKDFLAPEHPGGILKLIKRLNEYYSSDKGPILVHCSAGVGRTGTLVVIDSLMQQLKDEGQVDVYNAVVSVRRYRNFLVQSLKQYIFLYRALLEHSQFGDTEYDVEQLKDICNGSIGNQFLRDEFQKLDQIIEDLKTTDVATSEVNAEKNINEFAVPYDRNRVILTPVPSREHSTYINASFIQGYDRTDTFIITQNPLNCTINDFWRMIEEQCVSVIFNLTSHTETEYWPKNVDDEAVYDHIKIKLVTSEPREYFVSREFSVTNEKTSTTQNVIQLQLLGVESNDGVTNCQPEAFIALVQHVWDNRLDACGPAVVHCSNGADRSSTFIACSILLSQIKNEQRVDVFQIVRHMRSQRPKMIQNFNQYEFCYKTALKFLDNFQSRIL